MIKSMTGFGQAVGGHGPLRLAVEIRSLNHRFFECSTRLPNSLASLEEKMRDLIHSHIKRGKITVSISFRSKLNESNGLVLDEEKIDSYIRNIRKIQKKYRLTEPLSVNALLAVPSLFTVGHKEYTAEQYWASVRPVLEAAAKRLVQAKSKEGIALNRDFKKRVGLLTQSLNAIESVSKTSAHEHRDRLKERISELAGQTPLDPGRLEQEIAFLVERGDITEEVVRIKHHLDFLTKSLAGSGEIGKKLDFIAQELHREVNTIASKSQSSKITEEVVRMKSELEKIREQVQNVE